MSARTVTFTVSFDRPAKCSIREAQDVLRDHLSCMGGDLRPPGSYSEDDPGDAMFEIDRETIKVVWRRAK